MSYPTWGRAKLVKIKKHAKCRYCSQVIEPENHAAKEEYFFKSEVIAHYSHLKCYLDNESYHDIFIKKIERKLHEIIFSAPGPVRGIGLPAQEISLKNKNVRKIK